MTFSKNKYCNYADVFPSVFSHPSHEVRRPGRKVHLFPGSPFLDGETVLCGGPADLQHVLYKGGPPTIVINGVLGGGLKYFLFSSLFGEMIHFD